MKTKKMSLNVTSLPKYLQVSERILRDIASGQLAVGDRLPPERQMAADLGVAVGTLRKALQRLQDCGAVAPVQGSGNYIKSSGQAQAIYAFFPLEGVEGGGLPRAQLLSVKTLPTPARCTAFGWAPMAHRIRRLRLLENLPIAVEEIWLDRAQVADLSAHQISESLYLFYRETLNLRISSIEDRVGIGTVPDWASDIGLPIGAFAGVFDRESRSLDGATPEISRTWFNPDRAQYVARQR